MIMPQNINNHQKDSSMPVLAHNLQVCNYRECVMQIHLSLETPDNALFHRQEMFHGEFPYIAI